VDLPIPDYTTLYQFQKSLSGKTARFKQRSVLLYMSSTDIAEGCINQSLVKLVLSRRAKRIVLSKPPKASSDSRVISVDSTGLKVVGEKEWMNHKHGTKHRKVWRKLHLAINEEGEILSATLTTTHHESDVIPISKKFEW